MLKAKDKLDATIECPACGGGAKMSVTKNMTIFAYCKLVVDEETKEICGYRAFLGRTKSKDIIREYNAQMKEEQHVQDEPKQEQPVETIGEEGDVGAANVPTPTPDQPAKSIGGGFLGGLISGDSFL